MNYAFVVFILITLFGGASAFADCSSPAGVVGQLQWISTDSKVKYCNGTSWIDTTVSTGASCSGTTAGTINYSGGDLRYCNATNWISMKGASLGSCSGTTAGTYNYDSSGSQYRFCDGTNWYKMAPSSSGITVDATLARTTGTPNPGNTAVTSTSFTPPNNSMIVVCLNGDSQYDASSQTFTVSDSLGGTWNLITEADQSVLGGGSGNGGHASLWYRLVTTGAAMTISATHTVGAHDGNALSFKRYIITGHDASSPIGATGRNYSSTNNITPTAYTSTVANSRAFGCATEWNALGNPSSSTHTAEPFTVAFGISGMGMYKSTNTATSGTAVTQNMDAAAGTPWWWWVGAEIKPAP